MELVGHRVIRRPSIRVAVHSNEVSYAPADPREQSLELLRVDPVEFFVPLVLLVTDDLPTHPEPIARADGRLTPAPRQLADGVIDFSGEAPCPFLTLILVE